MFGPVEKNFQSVVQTVNPHIGIQLIQKKDMLRKKMTDIKLIGSILSNKSSLEIIKLLMKKEITNEQIANKLNRQAPAVHFHIQKLLKLKLLTVRKGKGHSNILIFYKMKPDFVKIITIQIAKQFK